MLDLHGFSGLNLRMDTNLGFPQQKEGTRYYSRKGMFIQSMWLVIPYPFI